MRSRRSLQQNCLLKRSRQGKKTWAPIFDIRLGVIAKHEHVGITTMGAGKAFVGLSGEYRIAAMKMHKLKGSLQTQIETMQCLSGEHLAAMADIMYTWNEKAGSQLLMIPVGYIYCCVSTEACLLQWCFGCETDLRRAEVLDVLNVLFASWPSLNDDEIAEFNKLCKATPPAGS